eukprot:scaffold212941_cov33-Prasinocladus_malaysianus.AAC.2
MNFKGVCHGYITCPVRHLSSSVEIVDLCDLLRVINAALAERLVDRRSRPAFRGMQVPMMLKVLTACRTMAIYTKAQLLSVQRPLA